jgi:hypothetical protein
MSMPTSSAEAGRLHALRTILGTAHAAARPRAPLALLLLCACMTTTVVAQPASVDPWQSVNRPVYQFNKAFDRFFIRPLPLSTATMYRYRPERLHANFSTTSTTSTWWSTMCCS